MFISLKRLKVLAGNATCCDFAEISRKVLTPSTLSFYLLESSSFTTPSLSADTWTKVDFVPTIENAQDFTGDETNKRFVFDSDGTEGRKFFVNASMSVSSSASNHTVEFAMYKNGVRVNSTYSVRWIAAGADTGSLSLNGYVEMDDGDYLEGYVKSSSAGTITFNFISANTIEA